MKKFAAVLLAAVCAVGLMAGCTPAKTYKDGKYRAEVKDFSHGYKEFLEITYKDDKIVDVKFDSISEKDPKILKSTLTADQYLMKDKDGNPFPPSKWYPTLIENIKKAAKPADIAAIAGATHTVDAAKLLYTAIQTSAKTGATATAIVDTAAAAASKVVSAAAGAASTVKSAAAGAASTVTSAAASTAK